MRWASVALLFTGCAHATAPTPEENTALAVDSAGLIVDVISFVADHFAAKDAPATTTLAFVLPDGGVYVLEVVKATVISASPVPVAPAPLVLPTLDGGSR